MIRRKFLGHVSVSAFVTATHGRWSQDSIHAATLQDELPEPKIDADARIRHLRLRTTASLNSMERFYCEQLEMSVVDRQEEEITLQAGSTKISFVATPKGDDGDPFYHVAFNIPENKHDLSKTWLVENNIDIQDVAHFRNWNAHAVFFVDPAENLLEFIARHDLQNAASGSFTPGRDVLCASEIAFLVENVPEFAARLRDSLQLTDYRRGNDQYATPGDEHGLLLVFKQGRMWHKPAQTFPAEVTISGAKKLEFESSIYPYKVEQKVS